MHDYIMALEIAEPWLEKGYRVKIQPKVKEDRLLLFVRVYENKLEIVRSVIEDGDSRPAIVDV